MPFGINQSAEREFVGTIEATDLDEAFMLSQNDFGTEYRKFGKRSSCVGDMFEDEKGKCFYVMSFGFKEK